MVKRMGPLQVCDATVCANAVGYLVSKEVTRGRNGHSYFIRGFVESYDSEQHTWLLVYVDKSTEEASLDELNARLKCRYEYDWSSGTSGSAGGSGNGSAGGVGGPDHIPGLGMSEHYQQKLDELQAGCDDGWDTTSPYRSNIRNARTPSREYDSSFVFAHHQIHKV